ncbi:MAG TPA: PepSY-associated TM helix domain-containing protein [Ideonella sp.]|uniref:PepSY-associated TM helix domain-containing protein n=1 Tax=Ideonella sp. TaxID=1929293 RepID=UPI002E324C47|nr:PepSY-associated TM helix domain-containing protein [Ideonella sp.]HEX5684947.1 PepSY-associated TM helix domain-containing protein [Ideonella sp.]
MNSQTRARWLKSILPWHWISSALTLAGLLVFAITGITLNHAAGIEAKPALRSGTLDLSAEERALLNGAAPRGSGTSSRAALPAVLNARLQSRTGLGWHDAAEAEWGEDEVYLALPRPGGDAWLRIDRASGALEWEDSDRGLIAWLNDLHKARHTGALWSAFIDIFAIACVMASVTGLVLLALHARRRPSTWPLVAAGLVLPALLAVYAAH